MSAGISRYPKFLPEDGSIPKKAAFVCRTCKEWFASNCGKTSHIRNHPDHTLFSPKTGREWQGNGKSEKLIPQFVPTNGRSSISPELLEYAYQKMRSEIEDQLDRLHEQLIPTPKGACRTYVAR